MCGLPSCLTEPATTCHSLSHGEDPITAVYYANGNGDLLVVDYFPGLWETCIEHGVPMQTLAGHNLQVVGFGEVHHDGIELGHINSISVESVALPDSPPPPPPLQA